MTTELDALELDALELETPAPEALAPLPAGTPKNLVANAGFEVDRDKNGLPDSWRIPGGIGFWDSETRLGFGHSLRLTNTVPGVAAAVYQTLPCLPNREYFFGGWVMGQGVSGPEGGVGASIAFEFIAQDGAVVSGAYPVGHRGTFGWSPINGKFAVPAWAASVRLKLYLGDGHTGTAWFDELVVVGALQVFVKQPAYRRTFYGAARPPWVAEVDRTWMIRWDSRQAYVRSEVLDAANRVVMSAELHLPKGRRVADLSIAPPDDLPAGDYRWRFALWNADRNKKLDEAEYGVRVLAAGARPKVYFDGERRTVVNGQRFFPLGFYIAEDPADPALLEEHLTHIAACGFNTVLSYAFGAWGWTEQGYAHYPLDFLNRVKSHGLRALYNLADFYEGTLNFDRAFPGTAKTDLELAADYIEALKGHGALLGWYLMDEPPLSLAQKIQDLYKLVTERDPAHPCFHVHTMHPTDRPSHVLQLDQFYDSADALGVDPYPAPGFEPLTMVSEWTEDARITARGAKPVWTVVGIGDGSVYNGNPCTEPNPTQFCYREPSLAEKRCLAYLALIGGAQGLIFYSYFDIFRTTGGAALPKDSPTVVRRLDEVRKLGDEFRLVTSMLLQAEPLDLKPTQPTPLRRRSFRIGGQPQLLVANPDYNVTRTVSFKLPPPPPQHTWGNTLVYGDLGVRLRTYRGNTYLRVTAPPTACGFVSLMPAVWCG